MKPEVVSVTLVGSAYRSGVRQTGFGKVQLDDGSDIVVHEDFATGFVSTLDAVDAVADTSQYRWRLTEWVRTGTMPLHVRRQEDVQCERG